MWYNGLKGGDFVVLKIKGMGCMHCVAKVRNAMEELGASVVSCEIGVCEIKDGQDVEKIREAIEKIGFELISVEA